MSDEKKAPYKVEVTDSNGEMVFAAPTDCLTMVFNNLSDDTTNVKHFIACELADLVRIGLKIGDAASDIEGFIREDLFEKKE